MRLLAEPSGIGRWRRRATGVVDRWSPSRKGYRTRLTVRPRPTSPRYWIHFATMPQHIVASGPTCKSVPNQYPPT